jgi:hypothetical protein
VIQAKQGGVWLLQGDFVEGELGLKEGFELFLG